MYFTLINEHTRMDLAEQSERIDLGFKDIKRMLLSKKNKVKILQYENLASYHSLDDLIGNDEGAIILLTIQTPNAPPVGHWIAVLKTPQGFEHFDSYGIAIDQELAITHEKPLMTNLVKNTTKKVFESRHIFQAMREHVNTCGRWCVVRILNNKMNDTEFLRFIDSSGHNPDLTVSVLTYMSYNFG